MPCIYKQSHMDGCIRLERSLKITPCSHLRCIAILVSQSTESFVHLCPKTFFWYLSTTIWQDFQLEIYRLLSLLKKMIFVNNEMNQSTSIPEIQHQGNAVPETAGTTLPNLLMDVQTMTDEPRTSLKNDEEPASWEVVRTIRSHSRRIAHAHTLPLTKPFFWWGMATCTALWTRQCRGNVPQSRRESSSPPIDCILFTPLYECKKSIRESQCPPPYLLHCT